MHTVSELFNHVRARASCGCLFPGYQMEIYFVIISEFRSRTYHYIQLSDKKSEQNWFRHY